MIWQVLPDEANGEPVELVVGVLVQVAIVEVPVHAIAGIAAFRGRPVVAVRANIRRSLARLAGSILVAAGSASPTCPPRRRASGAS